MKKHEDEQALFSFVREEDERLLYQYSNTAKRLRSDGVRQFFIPAGCGGVFLILIGSVMTRLFSSGAGGKLAPVLVFLGMLLISAAVIFYAIFLRRAKDAEGCALYITQKNVIYVAHGTYAKLPVPDITGVSVSRAERLSALPFDISALEVNYIILIYRGGEMKIPYIENYEQAAQKIAAVCGI